MTTTAATFTETTSTTTATSIQTTTTSLDGSNSSTKLKTAPPEFGIGTHDDGYSTHSSLDMAEASRDIGMERPSRTWLTAAGEPHQKKHTERGSIVVGENTLLALTSSPPIQPNTKCTKRKYAETVVNAISLASKGKASTERHLPD